MMIARSASSNAAASRQPTPAGALSGSRDAEKPKISPAERWLKIREKACIRAQKRAFVGGNPFDDWADAEKEVDAKFETDPNGASLSAPEQIRSQIECILGRFGLGDLSVDVLLERHSQAMERLARIDRTLIGGAAQLASRQTALAQDALHEAVSILQSVAQGKLSTDAMAKQADLSMRMMHNALSHLTAVTETVTGIASGAKKDRSSSS
jgi:hypothetical protein